MVLTGGLEAVKSMRSVLFVRRGGAKLAVVAQR